MAILLLSARAPALRYWQKIYDTQSFSGKKRSRTHLTRQPIRRQMFYDSNKYK